MKRFAVPAGTLVALLLMAAPAYAQVTATTTAATDVATTTATVNATVDLAGHTLIQCYFEYGTSTAYLSEPASCTPTPTDPFDETVSADLTGLTPGTQYDYQVVMDVVNLSAPMVTGGNLTFTTLATGSNPQATTGSATDVFATAATLNGTVNPGGETLTACSFSYGTNPLLLSSTAKCASSPTGNTAQPVSANVSGLTASTEYYYELTATNATGTATGAMNNFTTTNTATPAPMATTTAATNVTGTTATLNATVNPEGVGVQSCVFDYGTTTSYGQSAPCSPTPSPMSGNPPENVSANVTGLTGATTYHYQVVITTAGSVSASGTGGGDQSFTTADIGTASTGAATDITATTATANGTVNAQGQTVQSCDFYYGTGTGYQAYVPCSPATISGSTPQTVTGAFTGLAANTSYHYLAVLTTANGTAFGNVVDFTTLAEPTGATVAASGVTVTGATLNATVNPQGAAVVTCEFEYGVSTFGPGPTPSSRTIPCSPKPSGSSNVSVSATLSGLASATRYYYRILMETQGGDLIGSTLSFVTSKAAAPPVLRKPGVRIVRSSISAKHRTAGFTFAATGAKATGYQCALVVVTKGKAGKAHYSACRSPKTYKKLAAKTYEFLVRAGNAAGFGAAKTHRFTI